MSTLAFNKEGEPFTFSRRTRKLRPRLFRNPGGRGTCGAVLDAQGEQIYLDVDADYLELRRAVGNVPGLYRLDQCDDDGTLIEDAQPAYVTIEATRNAPFAAEADPMAIVRELAAINADVTKTMADRFAAVMHSTAEILRAADAAGIAHRQPLALAAPPHEADDDDQEEDDDELEPDPWAAWRPLLKMAEPHLPKLGAFLYEQFVAFMKTTATSPAAVPTSASPPVLTVAATTRPSSGVEPTGAAAGSGASSPTIASPTSAASSGAMAAATEPHAGIATSAIATEPATISTSAPTAESGAQRSVASSSSTTDTATTTTVDAAPATATPAPTTISTPAATAPSTALAIVPGATGSPRNAPPAPAPAQWQHLYEIRERLSPKEQAIAENAIARMTPELLAQWLAELSALSVDDAVRMIRSMLSRLRSPPAPGRDDRR